MLPTAKLQILEKLIDDSNHDELLWMSGYFAAVAREKKMGVAGTKTADVKPPSLVTIVYGTETGNSKKAATIATNHLRKAGCKTRLVASENYKTNYLAKEECLVLVVSTQGEGEPPATAKHLYDFLHSSEDKLNQMRYGVLALGSKSYPLFCQTGIDMEKQLKRLGAQSLLPIGMCDDDYEPEAEKWVDALIASLQGSVVTTVPAAVVVTSNDTGKVQFDATVGLNVMLNDAGSKQKVHHLEFDLAEDIVYTPGNAVGIVPLNHEVDIQKILKLLKVSPQEKVQFRGSTDSIHTLLTNNISIYYLPGNVIKKYAALAATEIPDTRMDLSDLLHIYPLPASVTVQALLDILSPITPRLYTISSSPATHPSQIHLTASLHQFQVNEKVHAGRGSAYLTTLKPGEKVNMFLHKQKSFQLPDDEKNIIMLAEGTGIAPFRSFLAERETNGATGKNWLMFAEHSRINDFYYQTEIQKWSELGVLQQFDAAFEQHAHRSISLANLVKEKQDDLWEWLQKGAHLYISGHKEPMGKAVEAALTEMVQQKQGSTAAEAAQYLKQLQRDGRFAKELY